MTKITNSNCDKTLKLKLWQNSKTQILIKFKKITFLQNSKTQIVTKLKNTNYVETQKLKFWQNSISDQIYKFFGKNILKLWRPMIYTLAAICDLEFFFKSLIKHIKHICQIQACLKDLKIHSKLSDKKIRRPGIYLVYWFFKRWRFSSALFN